LTGARSGQPVRLVRPTSDDSTGPKPGCRSIGPPRPIIEVLNITTAGLTSRSSSKPRPQSSIVPGVKFSVTMWAQDAMRSISPRALGWRMSTVTPILLAL
jgi:hypothetical protein